MFTSGQVAIWTLVLCGFFNSIMFPNIFTLGIAGLGPMTSKGSGLIMTAVVGGAVIPYLIGALADKVGIQHSFVIPVICYLYIAYYGLWGSKPRRSEPSSRILLWASKSGSPPCGSSSMRGTALAAMNSPALWA
jgi:MFS transporter, FHS family, L-fucose permease